VFIWLRAIKPLVEIRLKSRLFDLVFTSNGFEDGLWRIPRKGRTKARHFDEHRCHFRSEIAHDALKAASRFGGIETVNIGGLNDLKGRGLTSKDRVDTELTGTTRAREERVFRGSPFMSPCVPT
jgi:hypothetical protein